ADRSRLPSDPDRRPALPLGRLLFEGHSLLQLAARAGAVRGARLRRRPRALPFAGAQPLQEVLESCRAMASRLARSARVVARAWARAPGLSSRSLRKGSRTERRLFGREDARPGEHLMYVP